MSTISTIKCTYTVQKGQVQFIRSSENQDPAAKVKATAEKNFTSFISEMFESATATVGLTLGALDGKSIEIELRHDDPSATSYKISMALVEKGGLKPLFFLNAKGGKDASRSVSQAWVRVLSGTPSKPAPAVLSQRAVEHEECQLIAVSDAALQYMGTEVAANEKILEKLIDNPTSLKDSLTNHQILIEYNDAMIQLRNTMKQYLLSIDRDAMLPKLKEQLMRAGHAASEVDRYLSDEQSLGERLFFHSKLGSETEEFASRSRSILEHIAQLETSISDKIRAEYKSVSNGGAGHCFFYSCADLMTDKSQNTWLSQIAAILSGDSYTAQKSWRNKVADHLLANKSKYEPLVMNRMKTDHLVPKQISYEHYCEWIRKDGNWGGQPELEAFSEITQRPVIVLQNVYGTTPQWSAGINLHFAGEPLVFMNYSASHFEAMIKN